MKVFAMVLIVLGLLGLAYGGFTYTTREKVLDIGPLQATAEKNHVVSFPPLVGGAALVAGLALLVMGGKKA